jgi:phospholipid transport system substrate-binding protein
VTETPEDVIRQTADAVIAVLTDESLSSADKQAGVEAALTDRADFATISKLVVGRSWRDFTEAQKEEFVPVFKKYLSSTYGKHVDDYSDEKVEVMGGREEARGDYTVLTRVVRIQAEDVTIDYRLRKSEAGWRIIDFKAEGIGMIANLRSQFQEVLSQGGPANLLKTLKEKTATPEPAEPTPSE